MMRPVGTAGESEAAELAGLMEAYVAAHERLLGLAREHRAALARASASELERCLDQQRTVAEEVRGLDARRAALSARLVPSAVGGGATLSRLAQILPEAARGRVAALGERLMELVGAIQRENGIAAQAARRLAGHLDGVLQQVAQAGHPTRVYTPRGRLSAGGPVVCGLDLVR